MYNVACQGTLFPPSVKQGEPLALLSPVLADQLRADLDRASAGETPDVRSVALGRPGGRDEVQRFEVSTAPLRRGRAVIGVICSCREDASAWMAEHARAEAEDRVRALQSRIDHLADLSPSLLLRLDPCGQIRWMNGECQRYVGQTLSESRAAGWMEWIHPSEREAVMREWGRSTAAQTPFDHRHRLRNAAGVYGWFQVRCLPQFDAARRLTEWHAAALPLQEVSPLAQAIAANADGRMVLWVADPDDWTVHVLNPDPALGWPLGRASARVSWADHLGSVHAEDRAPLQSAFEALTRGTRVEHDYRAVTDRGDLLSVAEAAFPILDADGVVSRFVGLSRITSAVPAQVVVIDPAGDRHARVAAAIRATGFQPEVVDSFKGIGARRPAPPCVVYCSSSAYADMLEATRAAAVHLSGVPLVILGDPNATPHEILALTRQGVRDILSYDADVRTLRTTFEEFAENARKNNNKALPGSDTWDRLERLTPREREILELAVAGGTSKTIGRRLTLSPRTVDFHRSKALDKLGLDSVGQASALFSLPEVRPTG